MPRFEIQSDRVHAQIDPDLGAGLSDLSVCSPSGEWTPLLRRAPGWSDDPESLGCFIMAPWTNRVRGASLHWRGVTHALHENGQDGSAIHGEIRDRPWQIRHRTPQSAVLRFDSRTHNDIRFPWSFIAEARYEVSPSGLMIDLHLTNTSTQPAPFGMGLHPYFMRRLWADDDQVELHLPTTGRYPLDACIPKAAAQPDALSARFNDRQPLGTTRLDDLFTVDSFLAEMVWPSSGVCVRMHASEAADHAVLYSPSVEDSHDASTPWFCIEPMTMATNAANSAHEQLENIPVPVLEPGATQRLQVELVISWTDS